MSLLIKALDSAEKTKQAEKDKKQALENTSAPVALELELLEATEAVEPEPALQKSNPVQVTSQDLALTSSEQHKPANTLTLEEEAGLSNTPLAVNKYAKNKSAGIKVPASSAPLKGNLRETPNLAKPESTLDPITADSPFQARPQGVDANQQTAAKVFVANQAVKSASSKYALLSLGVAGALILWLGLQGYVYFKPLFAPDVIVVNRAPPSPPAGAVVETTSPEAATASPEEGLSNQNMAPADGVTNGPIAAEGPVAIHEQNSGQMTRAFSGNSNGNLPSSAKVLANNESIVEQSSPINRVARNAIDESDNSAVREPIKVTSRTPSPAIDPTLLSAYKAFTRGEDSIAQQEYRLVLQKDVRNTDALLGMAAIARRQGRHADAVGWFQKVLEIEPRNSIARSAIINSQGETDIAGSESRLKSMLASQPGGAHLHAALGNVYAEQNQWVLAQEAYFNASRFAPNNPDYAFNLAISLDQLGKTDLALKQYQRALALLMQSGGTSPDRAQLEARIQALQ